jgi:hypothetical protein
VQRFMVGAAATEHVGRSGGSAGGGARAHRRCFYRPGRKTRPPIFHTGNSYLWMDGWMGVSLTDLWARRNSLDFYRRTGPESGDSFPHGRREYHPLKKSLPKMTS